MRHVKMLESWEDPDAYMTSDCHLRVGLDADGIFDNVVTVIVNASWFGDDDYAEYGDGRLCAI